MKIEISNKRLDNFGRNEWDKIAVVKRLSKAFAIAKKESKKSLETEVRCIDEDGDVCGHYYFRKGKQTINMSV